MIAYLLIPLAGAVASGLLAWNAMSVESPPEGPPVIAFDLPKNRVLEDFSYRTFVGGRARGAAAEFRPLRAAGVSVTASGCASWVDVVVKFDPDPRWFMAVRATRSGQAFAPALRFRAGHATRVTYRHPGVDGSFVVLVSGEVRDPRAAMFTGTLRIPLKRRRAASSGETLLMGRMPPTATTRAMVNDFIAPSIEIAFQARWSNGRGPGSCWITTPQLIGGGSSLVPLGWRGLAGEHMGDYGPKNGATSLHVIGGRVLKDDSDPTPRQGFAPTWACSVRRPSSNYLADRSTCAAAAAVAEPGSDRRIQFELLLAGGLLSACIVGAAAGLRRLIVGP